MISAAYNIFCFIIDLMPRKTLYYILTPSHIIIWGKDRFDCLLGEGFFVCLFGGGWLGWGTARNSLQILQVTTIS